MTWSDDCFIFRALQNGKSLRRLGHISYSCLKDLFKKKVTELGFEATEFGLHSPRAGGTTAAANAGVPDRLFKHHDRKMQSMGIQRMIWRGGYKFPENLGLYLPSYSLLCGSKCVH